jgi:acyl-CoA reductase-like NAD-dependent aldehyde dehydrogenase
MYYYSVIAISKLGDQFQGKPLSDAAGEVGYGASFCEWFAEEGRRVQGNIVCSPFPTKRIMTLKQPIGVCGMITPVCIYTCSHLFIDMIFDDF